MDHAVLTNAVMEDGGGRNPTFLSAGVQDGGRRSPKSTAPMSENVRSALETSNEMPVAIPVAFVRGHFIRLIHL